MMLLCEVFAHPDGPCAVSGGRPETLLQVLRPEVNLAIWARPAAPGLERRLAPLAATPRSLSFEAPVNALAMALAQRLPAPAGLLSDLQGLALLFASLAESDRLRLRLECGPTPPCPRFHADAVGLRLLCTYAGPGTQWLCRAGGAAAARDLPQDPPGIHHLAPGAVALLKGEAGHPGQGCIHRSPPGGGPRLLLCLDAA